MMHSYSEILISDIHDRIPDFISGRRLEHSYSVEREAAKLAVTFSCHPELFSPTDGQKLRVAALLHDITKAKTLEEQLALCETYQIPLTAYERVSPKVLHAKTGAALARDKINEAFGWCVVDDAIFNAIWTHTTGDAHMTLMGKLLYLADYIEETRTFPDCVELRKYFYDGLKAVEEDPKALLAHLDDTLILSFDMTIRDLLADGHLIDPQTTAARNALLYSRHKG